MLVLYPYKNALWALRPAKPLGVLSRHPCRNPQTRFHSVKGSVCLVGSASCRAFGHTRPASVPGLSVGLPPQTKQGCLQSATQSHCTMRWHKWLTTCTGATPLRPHLYNQEVYRKSEAVAKTQQPALFLIDFYYLSEFYSHTAAFAFIQ